MVKPKRLLKGVLIVAALLIVVYDLTPQTVMALLAIIAEFSR